MKQERARTPLPRPQLWLFPATYAIHIAEEHWGGEGFHAFSQRMGTSDLSSAEVLGLNLLALGLMVTGCLLVELVPHHFQWLWVSLGAVVILNGISHLVRTLLAGAYSPGLVSGLVLWWPLGILTLGVAWRSASRWSLGWGLGVGLTAQAMVAAVARWA